MPSFRFISLPFREHYSFTFRTFPEYAKVLYVYIQACRSKGNALGKHTGMLVDMNSYVCAYVLGSFCVERLCYFLSPTPCSSRACSIVFSCADEYHFEPNVPRIFDVGYGSEFELGKVGYFFFFNLLFLIPFLNGL